MLLVTAEEMRELDRTTIEELGIPGMVLMEAAGRGVADVVCSLRPPAGLNVAVVAGSGNNGGDGYVVARHLVERGARVVTFLLAPRERITGDARRNLEIAERLGLELVMAGDAQTLAAAGPRILAADVVVDAVLGTGLRAEVSGLAYDAVQLINRAPGLRVAVDIPSGLSSETGWPLGVAVEAHHTVTFALAKVGLFTYPGCEHAGQVHVIDIGIPRRLAVERGVRCHLLEEARVRALLPRRRLGGHKGSYGHLLILAGSPGKTGAAALCAAAAVRGGAGLVTVATADDALRVVQGRVPEAMCERFLAPGSESATDVEIALARLRMLLEGKRALAVGPGIETSAGMAALLRRLVAELELPCVIDADGLNLLAAAPEALAGARAPLALTPHPGEMARLAGLPLAAVQADRMAITRALAARLRAWVALKGARTVIATPDGTAFINPTGNPGMGSGGTGDVLTGMVGALLAQGLTPFDALQVATYAHGRAGDEARDRSGEMGLSAGDLLRSLPRVLRRLETPSSSLAVDDAGPRLAPVVETPSSPSTYQ